MNVTNVTIDTYTEQLAVALFVSVIVHLLVIYGISFIPPPSKKPLNVTMDVILVQKKTDTRDQQPDYLAQATQEGGGKHELESKDRPATPTIAPFPSENTELVVTPPPPQIAAAAPLVEPETKILATTTKSSYQIEDPPSEEIPLDEEIPVEGNDEAKETTELEEIPALSNRIQNVRTEVASIQAELDEKYRDYQKTRKRHKYISASTKEYIYATYINSWRRKIEPIAQAKYAAIHQFIEASLLLDVAINKDGTIYNVELVKSSGYPVLDDVALRSVHNAAPYVQFSEEIRKETDILHITATWEFSYNNVTTKIGKRRSHKK